MAFSFTVSRVDSASRHLPVLGEPRQEPPPSSSRAVAGPHARQRRRSPQSGNVERRSERLPHDTVHAEVLGVHRGGLRLDEAAAHARIVAR